MSGAGDEFEDQRGRLLALAYRLVSSWEEAEDVVQEAHLRWARRGQAVEHPRAWLERVVTNLAVDHLKSARVRREQYAGPWLPEPVLTERAGEVDPQAISLAFLALLERLSPLERAVFVLAEGFEYTHREIAAVLGREEQAVRQLLHRAREHVRAGRPRFAADREAHRRMLGTFMAAVVAGDVAGVERLLAEHVTCTTDGGGKVKAARNVIQGRSRVARFLLGITGDLAAAVEVEVVDVNGWPSVLVREAGAVVSVTQLETDGELVHGIATVSNPDKLRGL